MFWATNIILGATSLWGFEKVEFDRLGERSPE